MKLTRTIHPQIRVVDEDSGLVDYIASDETVDCYQEVIRANGWRFSRFERNAPFIDSHSADSIGKVLGRVTDFKVANGKLYERVQWAIDVRENEIAQLGFRMTVKGYLRAVSVGFFPIKTVSRWDSDPAEFNHELAKLDLDSMEADQVRAIYLEQEQVELSACVIGANPNALARACRDGVVSRRELNALRDFQEWRSSQKAVVDPATTIGTLKRAIRFRSLARRLS